MLFDHKRGAWVEVEVVTLRSEVWKFKTAFERAIAPHCSFGFALAKLQSSGPLVDSLERLRSLPYMSVGLSEDLM